MILINSRKRLFGVGVDIYVPYLRWCKSCGIYDECILCDIRMWVAPVFRATYNETVPISAGQERSVTRPAGLRRRLPIRPRRKSAPEASYLHTAAACPRGTQEDDGHQSEQVASRS